MGWRGPLPAVKQKAAGATGAMDETWPLKRKQVKSITDGLSKTLLVAKSTNRKSAPARVNTEWARRTCMSGWHSGHRGGINGVMRDGSVQFIEFDMDQQIWAVMGSVADQGVY